MAATSAVPVPTPTAAPPGGPPPLTTRSIVGLAAIFLSAMMAGLNGRSGSLGLPDVRGALGFGMDDASWLNTLYSAGELIAMPFTTWFAITFSVRRFHLSMLTLTASIAAILPLTVNLEVLLSLRLIQGVTAGALIPILMMTALRILPPSIRLHGLALYAMTATFAPNVAIWLVGQWTDGISDWRWIYWQFIPVALFSGALVAWALPKEPIQWRRFSSINWPALFTGVPGLFLLAVALDQGNRLDWFNSPFICSAMAAGAIFLLAFILSEWSHPAPFIRFQLLARRNLAIGFTIFIFLLIAFISGAVLPTVFLTANWGYRAPQNAPVGLILGLPQLLAGSAVAILLYQRWMDARHVFAAGLAFVGVACFQASYLDSSWTWEQFAFAQALQAIGQPMAVVSVLFLGTSVVQPMEGPYVAGFVNVLRALGTVLGGALVNHLIETRSSFHSWLLTDRYGSVAGTLPDAPDMAAIGRAMNLEVLALATADVFRILGILSFALIPLALMMQYVPAPKMTPRSTPNQNNG
ncbi:MFS transporter [Sinirhodobacter populi]|uniref:MFS transporter n=1 Tax=Paenirhodobacter populi TaxID=2306993 RepID=A0A443JY94_9RHOB|nr:MFS transporter [Sinirhodobacter populi]RWR25503.1 MFS transporter [Sinirhodobacter populi]